MTTYSIVKAINDSVNNAFLGQERYYVVFADGANSGRRENIVGYATDESAKRRIRDLKRKEAEAVAFEAAQLIDNSGELAIVAHGVTIDGNGAVTRNDEPETGKTISAINPGKPSLGDHQRKFVNFAVPTVTGRTTTVEKLAASSDYGIMRTTFRPINRQVGVYPAIPKRAYQR